MIIIKGYIYDARYESIHPGEIQLELEHTFGNLGFNCSLITSHSSKAALVVKIDVKVDKLNEKIPAYLRTLVRNSRVFVDTVEYNN